MRKAILFLLVSLYAITGLAAFPTAYNTKTCDVSKVTGQYDSFNWTWVGMNDQSNKLWFATRLTNGYPQGWIDLTGYNANFRVSKKKTVYVDLLSTSVTIAGSNITFTVPRTNIPPNDTYQAEVWVYDGASTNYARTLAQGTIVVTKSLYADTNYFPFPTNCDLSLYMLKGTYDPAGTNTQLAGANDGRFNLAVSALQLTNGVILSNAANANLAIASNALLEQIGIASNGAVATAAADATAKASVVSNAFVAQDVIVSNGAVATASADATSKASVISNAFVAQDTIISNAFGSADTIVSNGATATAAGYAGVISNAFVAQDVIISNAANANIGIVSNKVHLDLTNHVAATGPSVHGLGTASTNATSDFATAAQGSVADLLMLRYTNSAAWIIATNGTVRGTYATFDLAVTNGYANGEVIVVRGSHNVAPFVVTNMNLTVVGMGRNASALTMTNVGVTAYEMVYFTGTTSTWENLTLRVGRLHAIQEVENFNASAEIRFRNCLVTNVVADVEFNAPFLAPIIRAEESTIPSYLVEHILRFPTTILYRDIIGCSQERTSLERYVAGDLPITVCYSGHVQTVSSISDLEMWKTNSVDLHFLRADTRAAHTNGGLLIVDGLGGDTNLPHALFNLTDDTQTESNNNGKISMQWYSEDISDYYYMDCYSNGVNVRAPLLRYGTNLDELYATAAQGARADTALQDGSITTNGLYTARTEGFAGNEYPSADWVRSLLQMGIPWYMSSNSQAVGYAPGTAQKGITDVVTNSYVSSVAVTSTAAYYIHSMITTQRVTGTLLGPASVELYCGRRGTGPGGGQNMSIAVELYYTYDMTNLYGDWAPAAQAIPTGGGATNKMLFTVAFPNTDVTNALIVYRIKQTSSANTTNFFVMGGDATASFAELRQPSTETLGIRGATGTVVDAYGTASWYDTTQRVLHLSSSVSSWTVGDYAVPTNPVIWLPSNLVWAASNVVPSTANSFFLNNTNTATLYMWACPSQVEATVSVVVYGSSTLTIAGGGLYPVWCSTNPAVTLSTNRPTRLIFDHPLWSTNWNCYSLPVQGNP